MTTSSFVEIIPYKTHFMHKIHEERLLLAIQVEFGTRIHGPTTPIYISEGCIKGRYLAIDNHLLGFSLTGASFAGPQKMYFTSSDSLSGVIATLI
jgi:hypothetical protein